MIAFFCASNLSYAQNIAEENYFLNGKEELDRQRYEQALFFLEKAISLKPNNYNYRYFLAIAHFKCRNHAQALEHIMRIDVKAWNNIPEDFDFYYAQILFRNEKIEQATMQIRKYLFDGKTVHKNEGERLRFYADRAQKAYAKPKNYALENLKALNTPYDDRRASTLPHQKVMFYETKRRLEHVDIFKNQEDDLVKEMIMLKIASADRFQKWTIDTTLWEQPNAAGRERVLQIISYNAVNGNKELLIEQNGKIGTLNYAKGEWRSDDLVFLNIDFNRLQIKDAFITPQKDKIFIAAIKKGKTDTDLFWASKNEEGQWTKPTPLDLLNSEYNEISPFLANDTTLYFCSQGHDCIGGYDVFKSEYETKGGTWQMPSNLGYPINSVADESSFSLFGEIGYLDSDRIGGLGGADLYRIFLFDSASLAGNITDRQRNEKVSNARVEFITTNKTYMAYAGESGKYLITLPVNTPMKVRVWYNSYVLYEQQMQIEAVELAGKKGKRTFQNFYVQVGEVEALASFQKTDIGTVYRFYGIYFETGSAVLSPDSYPELDKFAQFLDKYPNLKFEISGHTDNIGNAALNLRLSKQRAEAVCQYLIQEKGINPERLKAEGYGQTRPIASNDDEKDGRELNRRIEAQIYQD
ncbi:MAG: OmpA family protein [Bernardetiaceae bacterium]|nr:OmpA family protein [Bernardetiaceae bacterium]